MIQLLTTIGKTKIGKLLYILIFGVFMQSFSQTYAPWTINHGLTRNDTAFVPRGSNSVWERDPLTGDLVQNGSANPMRQTPYWIINSWPANFDSATMQTKITQVQADARYIQGPLTWNAVDGKPAFASVATSGSYNDLSNKPTITTTVSAPTANIAITMGTAFQPSATTASMVAISASLTGVLGLNETITIATSPASGGTYTTVASDVLLIGVLGLSLTRSVGTIPVPAGHWVKVTRSGTAASATYTKWNL